MFTFCPVHVEYNRDILKITVPASTYYWADQSVSHEQGMEWVMPTPDHDVIVAVRMKESNKKFEYRLFSVDHTTIAMNWVREPGYFNMACQTFRFSV